MKKNVGSVDKVIRFIIAIVATFLAYKGYVQSPWDYVLYVVAIIMLVTVLTSTCPIWLATGITTIKSKLK